MNEMNERDDFEAARAVKKRFGTAVKSWRGHLRISQDELAWRAGLHRTYVSDVERGARNLSLISIEKLATALEISAATLFSTEGLGQAEPDTIAAKSVDKPAFAGERPPERR
jgi:transcriptional regulator with XRE-family HTH domain